MRYLLAALPLLLACSGGAAPDDYQPSAEGPDASASSSSGSGGATGDGGADAGPSPDDAGCQYGATVCLGSPYCVDPTAWKCAPAGSANPSCVVSTWPDGQCSGSRRSTICQPNFVPDSCAPRGPMLPDLAAWEWCC